MKLELLLVFVYEPHMDPPLKQLSLVHTPTPDFTIFVYYGSIIDTQVFLLQWRNIYQSFMYEYNHTSNRTV
jgi:hypothetical protein